MDGLRHRGGGGATTFLATAFLNQKTEELRESFRKRFHQRPSDPAMDENGDQELQPLGTASGDIEEGFQDEFGLSFSNREEQFSFWTRIVLFLAAATLAFNVLVLVGVGFVLAAVIGTAVSITVGVVQLKLEDMETLREVHNRLRKHVNKIVVENGKLKDSVEELNGEVLNLKGSEERLKAISEEQGTDVESLLSLVKENGTIMRDMKRAVRDKIILELMTIAFQEERDRSGEFSDEELERLLQYMRFLPAVKINEELLKQALEKDRSIVLLLDLVSDIRETGVQAGDHIFDIDDEDDQLRSRFLG